MSSTGLACGYVPCACPACPELATCGAPLYGSRAWRPGPHDLEHHLCPICRAYGCDARDPDGCKNADELEDLRLGT